jgi:hypothetical protein
MIIAVGQNYHNKVLINILRYYSDIKKSDLVNNSLTEVWFSIKIKRTRDEYIFSSLVQENVSLSN